MLDYCSLEAKQKEYLRREEKVHARIIRKSLAFDLQNFSSFFYNLSRSSNKIDNFCFFLCLQPSSRKICIHRKDASPELHYIHVYKHIWAEGSIAQKFGTICTSIIIASTSNFILPLPQLMLSPLLSLKLKTKIE